MIDEREISLRARAAFEIVRAPGARRKPASERVWSDALNRWAKTNTGMSLQVAMPMADTLARAFYGSYIGPEGVAR